MLKQNNILISLTVLFLVTLLLSGCASMISGGPSKVRIKATPSDAMITVRGTDNGETIVLKSASVVVLNKNSDYVVTAASSGYKTQSVALKRQIHGEVYFMDGYISVFAAWFGNTIFLISLLPLVTDIVTDNIWYHTQNNVEIELSKGTK